ncbi:MAG TPA: FGGY-family carbohydrate kinase [Candidatus Nanopelagicaceae bacterium]
MERWILAIDLGNGGPKVAVVDLHDHLLAVSIREVGMKIGLDGSATQDANEWWSQLVLGAQEAIASSNVDRQGMHAVAITGQWGSTVPVDSKGIPVGDVMLWSDTRGQKYMREIIGGPISYQGFAPFRVIPWIRKTGGGPTPSGADPTGHSMVLQREMKSTHDRAAFLLEPIDYLGMRFTGIAGATPASMILSWITDNRLGRPVEYDAKLVRNAHRDPNKLAPLRPTGSILGTLLPEVAESLGVPTNVPVICGIPDLHSAVIGSGAVEPFDTHITISTTAWIGARVPFKKTDILHSIASVPGLDNNFPIVANNHETGGSALRWLIENVHTHESYESAIAKAETAPAGCEGLLFTPWLNGERSPIDDKKIRASFLNMSLRTDEAMMIRAVMEGVAFNSRWLFDSYEKFLGRNPRSVRIIGGGAQSDLWCQMHAYALNRPVERPADPRDAQLKGVASWARICLGEISLADAGRQANVTDTFLPDGPDADIYADLYQEYRRLYPILRKTHHRLSKITN